MVNIQLRPTFLETQIQAIEKPTQINIGNRLASN